MELVFAEFALINTITATISSAVVAAIGIYTHRTSLGRFAFAFKESVNADLAGTLRTGQGMIVAKIMIVDGTFFGADCTEFIVAVMTFCER